MKHRTCAPSFIRIRPQLFQISCYVSFLALSLNGEESLKKLSDLLLDLHQNWTNSSSSHTQLVHQVSSESVHNVLRYRAIYYFIPFSQWWRTTKIIRSGSGFRSSPKLNQFVVVTHPACPPSFIRIRAQRFEISCFALVSPFLSMVNNHLKIIRSGFRSSPKSNQFVLVAHPTCPQNFIQIHPQLFEISCTQANRQTNETSCIARYLAKITQK